MPRNICLTKYVHISSLQILRVAKLFKVLFGIPNGPRQSRESDALLQSEVALGMQLHSNSVSGPASLVAPRSTAIDLLQRIRRQMITRHQELVDKVTPPTVSLLGCEKCRLTCCTR